MQSDRSPDATEYVIVRKPAVGRYVAVACLVLVVGFIVRAFAVGKIDWSVVRTYLFDADIIWGIANSLLLTVCAMGIGTVIGLILALALSSKSAMLQFFARSYLFVFRSVPMLLQLLIWYNLALVFPTIGIPGVLVFNTTDVVTPLVASLLAFGLGQGAYTSEIMRAGLLSVGRGQSEAAKSIGMTTALALRRVILPQAMRVIVPPLGSETIGMVKYTSLASVIQYREIIYSAQSIYFANSQVIELLMVCAFWYAIVVGLLSLVQSHIERHFNRSLTARANVKVLDVAAG